MENLLKVVLRLKIMVTQAARQDQQKSNQKRIKWGTHFALKFRPQPSSVVYKADDDLYPISVLGNFQLGV